MIRDYTLLADTDLILLLKEKDSLAFTEIYNRYSMLIYYKINQMLRDENSSKDILQDLFSTIWTNAENLRADANLAGYLYIAARNRVLKAIQQGKTKSDYLVEIGKYSIAVNEDTLEKINEKELFILLQEEIGRLSPKMKEVFNLSRIDDLSHKEIATQLGITEATVRKQIQYALRILRKRLSQHGGYGLIFLSLFR